MNEKYEIFISHAVKDAPVVDRLMDFLKTAGSVPHSKIYCTSKTDSQIASNSFFKEEIFEALKSSRAVIVLMSENYAASFNCAMELGASINNANQKMIFLTIPPFSVETVPTFLKGVQMNGKITEKSVLMNLKDDLANCISSDNARTALWGQKVEELLESLPTILAQIPPTSQVSRKELDEVIKQKELLEIEFSKAKKHISKLKAETEALKLLKNAEEVKAVSRQFNDIENTYEDLVKDARSALARVSQFVQEVIYLQVYSRTGCMVPERYEYDERDWKDAQKNGFLSEEHELRRDNRVISKIINKIEEVAKFLDAHEEEKFIQDLCDEHDCEPYLSNKTFWDCLFN